MIDSPASKRDSRQSDGDDDHSDGCWPIAFDVPGNDQASSRTDEPFT